MTTLVVLVEQSDVKVLAALHSSTTLWLRCKSSIRTVDKLKIIACWVSTERPAASTFVLVHLYVSFEVLTKSLAWNLNAVNYQHYLFRITDNGGLGVLFKPRKHDNR